MALVGLMSIRSRESLMGIYETLEDRLLIMGRKSNYGIPTEIGVCYDSGIMIMYNVRNGLVLDT